MNFFGTIESKVLEANEDFEYVTVSLYKNDDLLEESGEIYRTEQIPYSKSSNPDFMFFVKGEFNQY